MVTDLYKRLKTATKELLDKSVELASHLENQHNGKTSNQETKKYIGRMQIHAESFREVLKEAQGVPGSVDTVRDFAAKLDSHLSMTRIPAEKLIEASNADTTATALANDFSNKRNLASGLVKEAYGMTNVQTSPGNTQNSSPTTNQATLDPFFWLAESGASQDTLVLSAKLINSPLDSSADQDTLVNVTVTSLLKDWDNGVAFIKSLATKAEGDGDQSEVSAAVSLLVFTRNQLRTLYNNLSITVQRLEQHAFV